ncbi:MAG: hypothetical protein ACOX60_00265 [Massiliimalia sp.]
MKKILWATRRAFDAICFVDRCLLLIMIILMGYIAVSFFFQNSVSQDISTIDIIVRTSAAAIFGYFVSGNFMNPPSSENNFSPSLPATINPDEARDQTQLKQIGFSLSSEPVSLADPPVSSSSSSCLSHLRKVQITVVTVIGIFSLLFLFFAANLHQLSSGMSATLSQLRDFVSACVGFLISCGKDR